MTEALRLDELKEELRAAREVIEVLRRRIEQDVRRRGELHTPIGRAITALENTVERRTRALSESEARYRALFEHSPFCVLTLDAGGRVLSANTTARTSLAPQGELIGTALLDLFPPQLHTRIESLLKATQDDAHELSLVDGRIFDIHIAELPGFPGAQVLLRDVSQRVTLARELQHSRRLAAIGHLAAGVAHEINNPLTVLQLGLADLGNDLAAERQPELREFIAHCDRIANIVSNLHTFAEPRPPFPERLYLRELLRDAKAKARESLGAIGLMMSLEHRDLSVIADRRQIEQVLVNLLGNAARSMGGKGHVNISGETRGDQVVVTISDEGPRIPEERLHQIFSPFVGRTEDPRTSFGVGLVLSMSWGLLQENRGSLRASNRPNGGANFEVSLPSGAVERGVSSGLDPRGREDSAPGDSAAPTSGLRILCVEDEAVLQRTLLRLLELSGHHAVGVSSAEAALELLAREPFDAMITDLRLPAMGGEELATIARERHPSLASRILLMSGFFRNRDKYPHFLQKPFTSGELTKALSRLVRHAERVE